MIRVWKTNDGTDRRTLRSWRKTAKQPATVRWTWDRMLRSASMRIPRSRTVMNGMSCGPILNAERGSWCWRRAVCIDGCRDGLGHIVAAARLFYTACWIYPDVLELTVLEDQCRNIPKRKVCRHGAKYFEEYFIHGKFQRSSYCWVYWTCINAVLWQPHYRPHSWLARSKCQRKQ